MPLDENPSDDLYIPWQEPDSGLLRQTRPTLPAFPLALLPDRWRTWVEVSARGLVPVDYVAQSLLGAVSAICGAVTSVRVMPEWHEPLVLWQALTGGRSCGKSPGLASARWLVEWVEPTEDEEIRAGRLPRIVADGTVEALARAQMDFRRGVVLWTDDLAGWMADTVRSRRTRIALAGWRAGEVQVAATPQAETAALERFPLGIVGALQLDEFAAALGEGDNDLAACFLYAWPEPRSRASLDGPAADYEEMHALLRRLNRQDRDVTYTEDVSFGPEAMARLAALLPAIRSLMVEADGLEAAWIGKGPGTVARLAALLSLMHWAQDGGDNPPDIDGRFVDEAYALWSGYFLPHARAILDHVGTTSAERLARRAARWLRRSPLSEVSLRHIRRDALAGRIDAAATEDVIERLEVGGVLHALATRTGPQGGRSLRRWAVNPSVRGVTAVPAVSADDSTGRDLGKRSQSGTG